MIISCHTGDQSASTTTDEAHIDARVREIIDMEDSSIVLDLRTLNTSKAGQYEDRKSVV